MKAKSTVATSCWWAVLFWQYYHSPTLNPGSRWCRDVLHSWVWWFLHPICINCNIPARYPISLRLFSFKSQPVFLLIRLNSWVNGIKRARRRGWGSSEEEKKGKKELARKMIHICEKTKKEWGLGGWWRINMGLWWEKKLRNPWWWRFYSANPDIVRTPSGHPGQSICQYEIDLNTDWGFSALSVQSTTVSS